MNSYRSFTNISIIHSKRLNVWRMYLHRYLRYTPLLAAILLFLITLMKFFIFGPMTYMETRFVRNCEKWWWTTLLHIQNYANPTEAVSFREAPLSHP
jgi:peptidoglycan/LPS O-acetylase OafA/YrhL